MSLRIHPAFTGYVVLIGLIDGMAAAIGLLLTLMIHETAHILAGMMCKERYESVVLTPLGGMITYRSGSASHKGWRGVLIAAAGPASNLAAVILLLKLPVIKQASAIRDTAESIIMMNISMAVLNLIPALPLDGGRIAFSIGYYLFPVSTLSAVLAALGRICGGLFIGLSILSHAWFGKLNVSLLAGGIYIAACAGRQGEMICASNLHAVIQERMDRAQNAAISRLVSVRRSTTLASIIPLLCKSDHLVFCMDAGDCSKMLEEMRVLDKLMLAPSMTFAEAFEDSRKE